MTEQKDDFDENVYDMCEMEDGSLWVATDPGGVKVVRNLQYEDMKVMVSSINTRSIVRDEFGNIWVGNYSTGIDFISTEKTLFHVLDYKNQFGQPRHVNSICYADDGFIWTSSEEEFGKWQDDQLVGRWSNRGNTMREYNFVRTMMADSRGDIWVGIDDQGVYRFNRQTGALSQINNTYPHALHKEDDESESPKNDGHTPADNGGEEEADDMLPLLLVVEDNADIRQYIADSFAEDFRILQAENGEEGVQKAKEHIPDINGIYSQAPTTPLLPTAGKRRLQCQSSSHDDGLQSDVTFPRNF